MTVQPGLQSLYNAGSSGTICDFRKGRTVLLQALPQRAYCRALRGTCPAFLPLSCVLTDLSVSLAFLLLAPADF